ncbi:hypothetical protein JTB14_002534 [Gonioctena quinquepunctata]|nr:hypothetical protein JTB14_002534 [Gonioctena quinquepunctata]
MLEFTDLSEQQKETDVSDLPATPIEHTLFNLPQSLIQSEQAAGTKSYPREIDGKQSEMEQEHSDPDYIEKNDTDNTDSSDVEDEDSASSGEAEAKENVDPSYGGELSEGFTKKGVPRKWRKFENSPDLRIQLKAQKDKQDHEVKPGCGINCKKKCSQYIPEGIRKNTQFWNLKRSDRKNFILQNISKANVARKTIIACENQFKRNTTVRYHLKKENGEQVPVCKIFFLTTLGYRLNQDKMLRVILHESSNRITPKQDGRKG